MTSAFSAVAMSCLVLQGESKTTLSGLNPRERAWTTSEMEAHSDPRPRRFTAYKGKQKGYN